MSDSGVKDGADVSALGRPRADDLVVVERGAGLIEVEAVVLFLLLLTVVCGRDLVEQIELR